MALSRTSQILHLRFKKPVLVSELLSRHSLEIEITRMLLDLALWVITFWELLGDWDSVVNRLLPRTRSPVA
jgi:hypothetical protein